MGTKAVTYGSSKPNSKTKTTTKITKPENKVYSRAEIAIIKHRIIELLQHNHTMPEIRVIIRKETERSAHQVNRYIAEATKEFFEIIDRDIKEKRLEMITSLRNDVDIAYKKYIEHDSIAWFHAYQNVKAKLMTLEPNELKAPEQQPDSVTQYTFNFNEIKGDKNGRQTADKTTGKKIE